MATGFSVFVNIGGKVLPSLGGAVKAAQAQLSTLSRVGTTIQAPFMAVQRHIDATAKTLTKIQRAGRDLTLGVTAPGAFAAKRGYDTVLGFEKELNKVKAYGELSDAEKERIEANARSIARTGLTTAKGAVEMSRRYIQAGRTVEQAIGMTKPTVDFSVFGDVDPAKAADVVTSIASAYQMPLKTLEESTAAATRIGDVIAKSANISRADVKDLSEGFKYAAPFAHRAGVGIEQLAAAIVTMNQAGIPGNETGVALRSMLVRMVKPTLAARTAMASMGGSFEQFVSEWKAFSLTDLGSTLKSRGVDISKLAPQLSKSIAGKTLDKDFDAITNSLTSGIVSGLKLKPRDAQIVAKAVSQYTMGLADKLDMEGMVKFLQEKGVSLGAIANLFDARQGARLSTLFPNKDGEDNFFKFLQQIQESAGGSSARGAKTMMEGLPGAHNRFLSGVENVMLSLAKSGVIDTVTGMLNRLAESLNKIGATNPETLKMAAGFAAAALAAGPLLLALGTLGRAGTLALTAVTSAAKLLAWPLAAAAGAATLLRGALMFTGIGAALTAIAAAGTAIYNNWQGLKGLFEAFGNGLKDSFGPTTAAAVEAVSGALSKLSGLWSSLTGEFNVSAEQWRSWGYAAGQAVGSIIEAISQLPSKFMAVAQQGRDAILGFDWAGVGSSIVQAIIAGIAGMAGAFIAKLGEMASAGAAKVKSVFSAGGGSGVGGSGAGINPMGDNFGGARATGGPVRGGVPYLVGERGPEIFVPNGSGNIETNAMYRGLAQRGGAAGGVDTAAMYRSLADRGTTAAGSGPGVSVTQGDTHFSIHVAAGSGDAKDVARVTRAEVEKFWRQKQAEQRNLLSD